MRVAIYGTGGAGGYFGAQLARAGEDVVFIARGAHLRAIQLNGLHIEKRLRIETSESDKSEMNVWGEMIRVDEVFSCAYARFEGRSWCPALAVVEG